jgi:diazepam-binding inhibitor (GABA receptor modulator, acyl-CoA-binding protein)
MELKENFESAQAKIKQLTEKPDNQDLLKLYSLFKQASEGDVQGERPGGFDFAAIAKFNSWERLKGTTKEKAMEDYIAAVDAMLEKYA